MASITGSETGEHLNEAHTVTLGRLVEIAADMINTQIPDDEIGTELNVKFSNGLAELIRRAAGIPDDQDYLVDDAIAWRNA